MTKILTIVAELAAVGLVAVGVYLTFGTGPALVVAGALLLAGIEVYGIRTPTLDDEDPALGSSISIAYDPDASESSDGAAAGRIG